MGTMTRTEKYITVAVLLLGLAAVSFVGYWRWWLDSQGIEAPMLPNDPDDRRAAPLPF
jgi:hypothetical protein